MNANELADKQAFEQGELSMWIRNETATMLRQQQEKLTKYELRHAEQRKRIEELEARIERMVEDRSKYEALAHTGGFEAGWQSAQSEIEALKSKTLTYEEITEVFDTTFEVRDFEDSFIKFARAILRKAQEK